MRLSDITRTALATLSIPLLSAAAGAQWLNYPTPGVPRLMLYESANVPPRTIYTDGRELPKGPNPTWFGYSVGRWDGDTLVAARRGL